MQTGLLTTNLKCLCFELAQCQIDVETRPALRWNGKIVIPTETRKWKLLQFGYLDHMMVYQFYITVCSLVGSHQNSFPEVFDTKGCIKWLATRPPLRLGKSISTQSSKAPALHLYVRWPTCFPVTPLILYFRNSFKKEQNSLNFQSQNMATFHWKSIWQQNNRFRLCGPFKLFRRYWGGNSGGRSAFKTRRLNYENLIRG